MAKMDDVTFFMLENCIQIARLVRNAMTKNAIEDKRMAEILAVSPRQMKAVRNGAYNFDLRLLSRLQCFLQNIASKDAKLKIEAETIGYASYKDQYPIYVNRIERLLKILEGQLDPEVKSNAANKDVPRTGKKK